MERTASITSQSDASPLPSAPESGTSSYRSPHTSDPPRSSSDTISLPSIRSTPVADAVENNTLFIDAIATSNDLNGRNTAPEPASTTPTQPTTPNQPTPVTTSAFTLEASALEAEAEEHAKGVETLTHIHASCPTAPFLHLDEIKTVYIARIARRTARRANATIRNRNRDRDSDRDRDRDRGFRRNLRQLRDSEGFRGGVREGLAERRVRRQPVRFGAE